MSTSNFKPLLALLGLLLAAGAVLALEAGTAAQHAWRGSGMPLQRELPQDLTRVSLLAALGDQARVAADWAYIDCLQYLGDPVNEQDGRFRRTLSLYREVLWLDPSFGHAGREGVSVLGWHLLRPAEAAELIEAARRWAPDDARYPAYLAALGYQERLDPAGVVEALREEAKRPDAPETLLRMLGNVYLKAEDWEGALTYWTWIRSRSKDAITLRQAERALGLAAAGLRRNAASAPESPR
jgi:tetratricopeptide (TPR) repeat protein